MCFIGHNKLAIWVSLLKFAVREKGTFFKTGSGSFF